MEKIKTNGVSKKKNIYVITENEYTNISEMSSCQLTIRRVYECTLVK